VQGHCVQPKPKLSHVCALAIVIAVNSMILMHYQGTDLGYSFVADFHYQLIRESLIFARFSAAGMGVGLNASLAIVIAYCGLYASIYGNFLRSVYS